ncbi:hypothetical protein B0E37_06285 [Streptomyces sp. MH192]|nr:hypothetical protein [Streptomyces sp. MH192]MCF0103707.1 hypothetical protein [Streptomyces sp. MH191]
MQGDDQQGRARHEQRAFHPVQDGGQRGAHRGGAAQGGGVAQRPGARDGRVPQPVEVAGAQAGVVGGGQPGGAARAHPAGGERAGVGEEGAVGGEGEGADAAAAEVVEAPVGGVGARRTVQTAHPDLHGGAVQAVGDGEPVAGGELQALGGGLGEGDLDGAGGGRGGGGTAGGEADLAAVQRGEEGEVRIVPLAAATAAVAVLAVLAGFPVAFAAALAVGPGGGVGGRAQGAGEGVRAGAHESAYGHGEPVEGAPGARPHRLVRRRAPLSRDLRLDDQRGLAGRGGLGEGVAHGGVAEGARVGGEGGQDSRGQHDGEECGREQQAVRASAQ